MHMQKASIVKVGVGVEEYGKTAVASSPIFGDGSFRFIPVPERYPSTNSWRYEDLKLTDWVPRDWIYAHYDPEFVTFTWGSYENVRSSHTRQLSRGDIVFFISSMTYDSSKKVKRESWVSDYGMYIIGFFELEEIPQKADITYPISPEVKLKYWNNAHVRRDDSQGDIAREHFLIFKGSDKSRLLKTAIPFSSDSKPNELARIAIPRMNLDKIQWWSNVLITKDGIDAILSAISMRN